MGASCVPKAELGAHASMLALALTDKALPVLCITGGPVISCHDGSCSKSARKMPSGQLRRRGLAVS